jgi:glycosyltransferase involved in cell wall biosynthesis
VVTAEIASGTLPPAPSRPRRAVLLIANAAAPYSRGLRVARSLVDAGWEVQIAAMAIGDEPRAERDHGIEVVRYRPSGRWVPLAMGRSDRRRRGPRRLPSEAIAALAKLIAWPVHVRAWWSTLRRDLAPADLYHAFGILTIGVALELAADARRRGHQGRVVYDVIDVILESNNVARLPGPVVAAYRWQERRWARRADAIVTVNEPLAAHLARRWPFREQPTVLMNCQPRWTPPDHRPDLIRSAAGLPASRRIVLFLGRLGRERGLDEAAAAVLAVDDTALAVLGFGPWADRLRERDRDPRFAGRHVTLPAVHPLDVPRWTASADVSIVAVPANSLNQRLSTPNKFWESLTAGTPIVVGRDLEVMRGIVESERIGAIADPADPDDLARAIRAIIDAPAAEREAMRLRCVLLARDRYNWETAVVPYLALVERLSGPPPGDG